MLIIHPKMLYKENEGDPYEPKTILERLLFVTAPIVMLCAMFMFFTFAAVMLIARGMCSN